MSATAEKLLRIAGVIALGAVLQGCSAAIQSPVRVLAEPRDVNALVGSWSGEYNSAQSGRSGSIVFRLRSATDTAYGDVVMVPRASVANPGTDVPGSAGPAAVSQGQVLSIRFVRLEGSHVVGRMDPYTDPVCGCRLTTVFTGNFTGDDKIEGTFQTTGSELHHPLVTGKWKVTRSAL